MQYNKYLDDYMFLCNQCVIDGWPLFRIVDFLENLFLLFDLETDRVYNDDSYRQFRLGFPIFYKRFINLEDLVAFERFRFDFTDFINECFPKMEDV